MPSRISPGTLLVAVVLLILLFNPGSSSSPEFEDKFVKSVIALERLAWNTSRKSAFGSLDPAHSKDLFLNLTGFRKDDDFDRSRFLQVQNQARSQLDFATNNKGVQVDSGELNSTLLVYNNVTGWAKGRWVRSRIPDDGSKASSAKRSTIRAGVADPTRSPTHNITGTEGRFQVSLRERRDDASIATDDNLGDVSARVMIQDSSSNADGWSFVMKGIHDHRTGNIILTTTSESFAGIFALAHFALSPASFSRMKHHVIETLNNTISLQESNAEVFSANPWGEATGELTDLAQTPACELIVYLQQFTLTPSMLGLRPSFEDENPLLREAEIIMDSVEGNLRRPNGLRFPSAPQLQFVATAYSPDCGYVLESKGPPGYFPYEGKHLVGVKYEIRMHLTKQAMVVYILILAGQTTLLMRQIIDSGTPSKKSRISFTTIAMLSLGSGFVAFAFLLLSSLVASLLVLSMAVAFLAFMDGLFYSMKFLLDIWTTQEPERMEQGRREHRNIAARPTTTATAVEAPATASTATSSTSTGAVAEDAIPIAVPTVQNTTAATAAAAISAAPTTFGSMYTRYCLCLLFIVFFSIWVASSWPQALRTFYANALVLLYLSFWVPQIYRNILRNCRKALSKRFVIGQSVLRLLPIAYCWGLESNVLFAEPDSTMLIVFAGWLWVQMVVLFGQEVVGPRFFVSEEWSWVPPAYQYHPILREDEEAGTMPVGFEPSSPTEERSGASGLGSGISGTSKGKRIFDCAICMQQIEVPVVPSGQASAGESSATDVLSGGFLTRRLYSVTPCRHIFHTHCLESWMSYRLQCPICRESLPPL